MAKLNDTAKLAMTLVTALTGVGGSWYKMEQRVTRLEQELAKQERLKTLNAEIELMKRDQELEELKFRWKLDSLKNENK